MVVYPLLFDPIINPLYILGKLVRNLLCEMEVATASSPEITETAATQRKDKQIW